MIHLDTTILITALCGPQAYAPRVAARLREGARFGVCTLVLYEWRRGPRIVEELTLQEFLVPTWEAVDFGPEEAQLAAHLYRAVRRPRAREVDLAIAACAMTHDAQFWTRNVEDFDDIPGLALLRD